MTFPLAVRAPRFRCWTSVRVRRVTSLLLGLVLCGFASRPLRAADLPATPGRPAGLVKRVYHATHLTGAAPKIDGHLDEDCWITQGAWADDYTQFSPRHAVAPSEQTTIKILYDEHYLYVAIRALDDHPELMTRYAGPRDAFTGDIVGVTFDSYFDHRHAFEFDLTSAGQKIDLVLGNDTVDTTWDPIWDGKVSHDAHGWYAEMRIPFSQLRYTAHDPQIWGMHAWRWVARRSEESQWNLLPNDGTGMVYSFGELQDLHLPAPRRHLEVVPYASLKYTSLGDPGENDARRELKANGGADAKLQLSSSFTLDATVKPDFAQVGADPSEMNLSAFETFLTERRPFFIEGKNIFDFSFNDQEELFYSRRIGHHPALDPRDDAYAIPDSTSILGAWKISGKTDNGLSLGVLHAVTDEEHALYRDGDAVKTQSLEPASQYALVRLQQELNAGQTVVGGIATFTTRSPKTDELRDLLPKQAMVGGVDFEHNWADRTYYVEGKAIASHVTGSPGAIDTLQTASAHYYQRPDADYLDYDPTRTSLDGWGGQLSAGKRSKGHWRYYDKLMAYSPGLDFNDMGYLREADRIQQRAEVAYVQNDPTPHFRDYSVNLRHETLWDFGGEHLRSKVSGEASLTLRNKFHVYAEASYAGEGLDPTALRGGPALRGPAYGYAGTFLRTDSERRVVASLWADRSQSRGGTYRGWDLEPSLKFRPVDAFSFSFGASKSGSYSRRYYVDASATDGGQANMMATLRTSTISYTARAQWFIRPELSIQYYGSPFGSSGSYSNYEHIVAPRASDYASRGRLLPDPVLDGDTYHFDENGDGRTDYTLDRPDFGFAQFRSNLVLRWEFRPGSDLYVVWSQERTNDGDPAPGATLLGRLAGTPATDVLLIKCSYWFGL